MVIPNHFFSPPSPPTPRCHTNLLIFNSMSLVPMNNLQLFHCHLGVLDVVAHVYHHHPGFSVHRANVFVGPFLSLSLSLFFACVICATVIECGSKKALRKTQG